MNSETSPENSDTTPDRIRKSRIILLLLATFFALPYLVVFIYQANPELSVKTGMSNKGHLFSPVHSLEQVANDELNQLKGMWTIIYVSGESCDQACINQHFTMRQVRLASAKRRYKIERLNLVPGGKIDDVYTQALAEFPREKQILLDADNKIMSQFDDLPIEEQIGRIYLMDPHLNVVLRYSAQTDPKHLLHDINKLIVE
jgi:hypothetical protein